MTDIKTRIGEILSNSGTEVTENMLAEIHRRAIPLWQRTQDLDTAVHTALAELTDTNTLARERHGSGFREA